MPNNITNIITFDCTEERFTDIAESLKRDGSYIGSVDFNKLIPMPRELDITSGSLGMSGFRMYMEYLSEVEGVEDTALKSRIWEKYLAKSEYAQEALELGRQYHENIEKYGSPTWYEWCCDHWGTKWNAYNCDKADMGGKALRFETAWSSVPAIVKSISERFPEVLITYEWADEDIGRNVGSAIFRSGSIKDIYMPEQGSKDAYEMSARIIGFDLVGAGFKLTSDGKTYIYCYEEEDELIDVG